MTIRRYLMSSILKGIWSESYCFPRAAAYLETRTIRLEGIARVTPLLFDYSCLQKGWHFARDARDVDYRAP